MEGPLVDRLSDAMTSVASRLCRASGRGVACRKGFPSVRVVKGYKQKRRSGKQSCSAIGGRDYLRGPVRKGLSKS